MNTLVRLLTLVNIKSMFILVPHLNGQLNGIPPKLFRKQSGHHIWTQHMAIVTYYKTPTIAGEKSTTMKIILDSYCILLVDPHENFS